jgi:hypothetical protein
MITKLHNAHLFEETKRSATGQLTAEEMPKWERMNHMMMNERRAISIEGLESRPAHEVIESLTMGCAQEILEKVE